MSSFPLLKSGAVAQHPLTYSLRNQTQRVEFLDGTSQRYALQRELRRWTVSLSGLDEQELDAVVQFVDENEGGVFAFGDPVSGEAFSRCVLRSGAELLLASELNGSAVLVIEEIA